MEKDHSSSNVHDYLLNNQDELLESLQCSLRIPEPPTRTKRDETQITSLVRALLELSGGSVEAQQHRFIEEYTASENADLYASIFNITRSRQFGNFDPKEMCKTFSKSVAFSGMAIGIRYVEEWTAKMMDPLRAGFGKVSHLKMSELREDGDSDWVTITLPEALPVQDHSPNSYSDHTLLAMKMRCVLCCIASFYLFILT